MLGSSNPNFRDIKKFCIRCGIQYHAYSKTRKYCSDMCASISNRKMPEYSRRNKPRSLKVKKSYICPECNRLPMNRKNKRCDSCRVYKNKVDVKCKQCNKDFISYKTKLRVFCSKKCQLLHYNDEGNPNYIDGRNPENKKIRNSKEYKEWRMAIFKRDKYTCLWCGKIGGELNADHILPFSQFPELRLSMNNGRTLCKKCHEKTPTYRRGALHMVGSREDVIHLLKGG